MPWMPVLPRNNSIAAWERSEAVEGVLADAKHSGCLRAATSRLRLGSTLQSVPSFTLSPTKNQGRRPAQLGPNGNDQMTDLVEYSSVYPP